MAVVLHSTGAAHARMLIAGGNYDNTSPWSFSAEDGDALLGSDGNDWMNFGRFHLGEDTSATPDTKARFKYPYGKVGKVYGGALRAIRSRASQQNETAIYDMAGTLLDLLKSREGDTSNRRRPSAQAMPAYDPDGDGDNDAENAAALIKSACVLLGEAMDCLMPPMAGDDEGGGDGGDMGAGMAARAAPQARILAFQQPAGKSILRVRGQGEVAEIDLFGVVGGDWVGDGITKEQFAAELRNCAGAKVVNMRMSSPGGSVHDGRAIANMIRQHPAKFAANVIAEASSVASIIAMACDTVNMAEGSVMLVHRCFTMMIGNCMDMRQLANDLETIDNEAIQTYARKTGMKPDAIASLMDENRYMSAAECKKLGFADTIDATAAPVQQTALLRIAAMNADRSRLHLPPLPETFRPKADAALSAIARMRAATTTR